MNDEAAPQQPCESENFDGIPSTSTDYKSKLSKSAEATALKLGAFWHFNMPKV